MVLSSIGPSKIWKMYAVMLAKILESHTLSHYHSKLNDLIGLKVDQQAQIRTYIIPNYFHPNDVNDNWAFPQQNGERHLFAKKSSQSLGLHFSNRHNSASNKASIILCISHCLKGKRLSIRGIRDRVGTIINTWSRVLQWNTEKNVHFA